jgi:putative phage-type endonuclease
MCVRPGAQDLQHTGALPSWAHRQGQIGREVGDEDRFGAALIADLLVLARKSTEETHHRCRTCDGSPAILVVIRDPTEDAMSGNLRRNWNNTDRRDFIGGSDARVVMGQDDKALIRLWQEKRGEVGPEDLSTNLIVQLGLVTEDLNRQWYERNTGNAIKDVQCQVEHPVIRFMAATLDGVVSDTGAVYEAKFMLPWSFSEEGAAEKYMAQLQHNMWVTNARMAALSIITGGGKWVEISIAADPLYQHLLLTAEKKFWRCVRFGEPRACSGSSRRGRASRRCGASTWGCRILGRSSQRYFSRRAQPSSSTRRPRPNSRG